MAAWNPAAATRRSLRCSGIHDEAGADLSRASSQWLLARGAQNLGDTMYRQQLHDEQVALAGNIH
jgi:hypothetical protein